MKVFIVVVIVALLGFAGYSVEKRIQRQNAVFEYAVRHRKHQEGEQGQVAADSLRDMQRAMPAPDPKETAAANQMSAVMPYMDTASVKAMPPDRRMQAINALLTSARVGETMPRVMAVDTLGEIGDARAIPGLCTLKHDPDTKVAEAVRKALIAMNYPAD